MSERVDETTHERLAGLTTLRLGGPARELVHATDDWQLVDAVRRADASGTALLVLAGGSNVVVADTGFDGVVVRVETTGVAVDEDTCGGAMVTVAAGEPWDSFVGRAVDSGWVGLEALSGIPGSVGATPIQNVGAYGQEVADTIASVRCWDRVDGVQRTYAAADCGFAYRTSRFKREPDRHVVLSVTFQLRLGTLSAPVRYAELADRLGVALDARVPMADVRRAVIALRAGKGMVLDPSDHDTWSAGSFFTNPVLAADAAARLPPEAPRWPQANGSVKTSAAWLIEHAGFAKGFGKRFGTGRVALSDKHTLAISNRGGARTADLLALAAEVRGGVLVAYGVRLVPEPVLVGCSLPEDQLQAQHAGAEQAEHSEHQHEEQQRRAEQQRRDHA